MYCHNCGNKTSEEFCSKCGTKVLTSGSKVIKSWRNESDFSKIARHSDVLDFVTDYAKLSKNKLSEEDFLKRFDLVFNTLTGLLSNLLVEILVPLYRRLGIKTGKSNSIILQQSIKDVFVKTASFIFNKK